MGSPREYSPRHIPCGSYLSDDCNVGSSRQCAYHQGNHHRSIDSATGTLVTLHMTITVDGLLTVHVVSAAALTSEAARAVAVLCLGTVVRIVAHPEHPI